MAASPVARPRARNGVISASPFERLVRAVGRLPGPAAVVAVPWRHRALIARLTRRELEARYRGSLLGFTWSILVPVLLLGVYTYVFSVVFESRWPLRPTAARGDFAVVLWSGLIFFNFFAECVNRAPTLLLQSPDYIKRVVFPLEILTWVILASAAFNAMIGIVVLAGAHLLILGAPPVTALAYPLMFVPIGLVSAGLTWLLSSLGVFVRDLAQVVPVLVTVTLMMSPIFYPREAVPASFSSLVALNPIAATVEQGRQVLFAASWPDWKVLASQLAIGWLVAWVGLAWFSRTRKAFADVV